MSGWAYAAGLGVVLTALSPPPAGADQGRIEAALLACANETDDARRLRCFDATVAELRSPAPAANPGAAAAAANDPAPAAVSSESSAATVSPETPAATVSPEDRFGLRGDLKREKLGELSEITATAFGVTAKPRGELVITLDNGQVWAEIAPGSGIRLKAGDPVRIEAGALRSFILIAPNGRSSKVSRIR